MLYDFTNNDIFSIFLEIQIFLCKGNLRFFEFIIDF